MAAKRIYQLAKEFERDEKEIIEYLSSQGIKVANRLSAVNDDTYNLLKVKFTEPPKVEEPEPPKVEETPAPTPVEKVGVFSSDQKPADEQAQPQGGGKKKKKNKNPQQPNAQGQQQAQQQAPNPQLAQQVPVINKSTQEIYNEAIQAGNAFIETYVPANKRKKKRRAPAGQMGVFMDSWGLTETSRFDFADSSPSRYWQAVNKLTTAAYKKSQEFGLSNRKYMAEMREAIKPVGEDFVPREIFTDEENEFFATQQRAFFVTFGHGQGALNDNLLALKIYCENMSLKFERMDYVDYLTNPNSELNVKPPVPFDAMAEVISHGLRGLARRLLFYRRHKDVIAFAMKNFFEWVDGYQKLKEQNADPAKLKKYLELEGKFISLTEFMAMDNLLHVPKNKTIPYINTVELLNTYRDDLDNPEAETTFKYNLRGLMNLIFKPKEFVFLWQLGEL